MGEEVVLLGVGAEACHVGGADFVPVAPSVRSSAHFVFALTRFLRRWTDRRGVVHAQRPDDLIPFHLRAPELPKVVTLHGVHGIHVEARRGRAVASIYRAGEHYSLARTRAILCVSPITRDYFQRRYPRLSPLLRLIPAGIDFDLFRPEDRTKARKRIGVSPEDKLLTFVGRFEPEKNPLQIMEEVVALRSQHPDLCLLMIGNGALAPELRQRANLTSGACEVREPVVQEELARVLAASDALVVASTHEGLPTVALEAMACGVPVVGTPVGILPDIVRPGVNGYLAHAPSDLRTFIEKALYGTTWVASDCRASVRSFGWDQVAPAILEVYREISA